MTCRLWTEFDAILVSATYVLDSGHHDILGDSHMCLAIDYKHLHSDILGYKLLKEQENDI